MPVYVSDIIMVVIFFAIVIYFAYQRSTVDRSLPPDRPTRETDIAIYPILEGIVKSSLGQETLNNFCASNWDEQALKNGDYGIWYALHSNNLLPTTWEIRNAIVTALQ
jgi:hypothetical protein